MTDEPNPADDANYIEEMAQLYASGRMLAADLQYDPDCEEITRKLEEMGVKLRLAPSGIAAKFARIVLGD